MLVQAATVVCVRQSSLKQRLSISKLRLLQSENKDDDARWLQRLASSEEPLEFKSSWEVLMGQSEVQNWLKSTATETAVMRYPGEMKFPGGAKDETDPSMEAVARRELEEEFHTNIPSDAKLRLFSVKRTKPVRGVSFMMHNYVALADENPWLQNLNVNTVNAALSERRSRFQASVKEQSFWGLSRSQKEALSPEVQRVEWIPIRDAAWHAMTSKAAGIFVNDFQRTEFERLGVKARDPMFQTMVVLLELDGCPTKDDLIAHCDALPSASQLASDATTRFLGVDPKKVAEEDDARLLAEEERLRSLSPSASEGMEARL